MTRPVALLASLAFLLVAPGTVVGLVPWWISRWRMQPPFLGLAATRAAGVLLLAAALPVLVDSFVRFAMRGRGTPAPVLPPRHLVVSGLYQHVRNPMYVAVVASIVGQGLLLGDLRVVGWGALVWAGFHLFVVGYEEPALRRAFGEEYDRFRAAVPRWVPRWRAWRAG
jgi:protein-S-isoprenylcysteine O-methyltransferase Ste14